MKKLKLSENFYIDDPIFLAPMAGVSDKPFRKIIAKFSQTPMVTEMISSHSLVEAYKTDKIRCLRNFDRYDDEKMTGAQIFGANPKIMAESAKIIEGLGAKWIDINMGCPVPKVATRAKAGAFLMQNHKLAEDIISEVKKSISIPLTIKTRLGWDESSPNTSDLVDIAYKNGASFVLIHGRTRAMNYSGNARWEEISDIAKNSQINIIGNGDITDRSSFERSLSFPYISGIAIGRAIMGKPWFFAELLDKNFTISKNTISDTILEHFELSLSYYGAKTGLFNFRKHLAWYCKGMKNSTEFRLKINSIQNPDLLKKEMQNFFDL